MLNICGKIEAYEESKKNNISKEWLFIFVKDDGIYLSDIKIIDKKAELQIAIFKILIDLYCQEIIYGSKYITISEICSLLESRGITIDDENQIRVAIYYIRAAIKATFKHLNNNSVIESQKWKGYRLSNSVLLKRF